MVVSIQSKQLTAPVWLRKNTKGRAFVFSFLYRSIDGLCSVDAVGWMMI